MTIIDSAKRIKEEWSVQPSRKERMVIVLEYLTYLLTCIAIAVTVAILKDMLTDYVTARYTEEKDNKRGEPQ